MMMKREQLCQSQHADHEHEYRFNENVPGEVLKRLQKIQGVAKVALI